MDQLSLETIHSTALIDIGFWNAFSKKKIEEYKLDDQEKPIIAKTKLSNYQEKFSHFYLDAYSFLEGTPQNTSGPLELFSKIQFKNFNTIEEYHNVTTHAVLTQLIDGFKESFSQNAKPQTIQGKILMFADLKKYLFTYRLCLPQIKLQGIQVCSRQNLNSYLGDNANLFIASLQKLIQISHLELQNSPFFIVKKGDFALQAFDEYMTQPDKSLFDIVYIDSYNQTSLNAGFNNLLYYLKTNPNFSGTTQFSFVVIKDQIIIGSPKVTFKNSQHLVLDLSNLAAAEDLVSGLDHYSREFNVDLKSFMDEAVIAKDAVDLNIKLMKWRLLPQLDLDKIKATKCLLVGAGTLGCQLARTLIGWGIRHITFVDYGKISYSNPVRQTLYNFEDSKNGGKPKAEVAAQRLKEIFPDIAAEGYSFEIPMPGHYVTEAQVEKTLANLRRIDQLVSEHDVVYLLTDSRESRWLPTLLANKHNKICMAVALGFDSYLIIRHGISIRQYDAEIHGERLACYFCNDFNAPQNSTKDRTLDQQCTVTRPGLSFLAAGYSAELLISLLHHPLQDGAPASDNPNELQQTDLGILPHFIRGQLSDFDIRLFYGRAYNKCVACSQAVLDAYDKDPDQFILHTLNRPEFLQDVTGITADIAQMNSQAHQIQEIDDFAIIQ